jgi:peptide/nickel transport system substrate-binding protein
MTDRSDPFDEWLRLSISRRTFIKRAAIAVAVPTALAAAIEACSSSTSTATVAPTGAAPTGAAASAAPSAAKKLSTLVVAVQEGDTRTLDPQSANELTVPIFLKALYDQLVTFPGSAYDHVIQDFAASGWTVSPDGLTYVFNVNPAIKFLNGVAATADDLVFSLKRHKNLQGNTSWFQDAVASVEKTGDMQVTMKLKAVNVDLLNILTSPFVSIGNQALMTAQGANDATDANKTDTAQAWLDQHSVGSGPFVLDAWTHGSQMTMHSNPYYWGPPPPIDKIVFKFTTDQTVQRDMLVRGDAQIAVNMTPDLAAGLAGNPQVKVLTFNSLGFVWLGLNVKNDPHFANPKNWEAVRYAIDYDGMAQIYKGGGSFYPGIIPQGLANAMPMDQRPKQDVARAKAALAAAGNPNGFAFKMTYANDQLYGNIKPDDIAQKLVADLEAIGLQVTLDPKTSNDESTQFRAGKSITDMHIWGADYVGWTDFLPTFAPDGHVSGPRHGWTSSFSAESKQITDLSNQAQQTIDPTKQNELCTQAQNLMKDYSPFTPLFGMNYQVAIRSDVIQSIETDPVWFVDVSSIKLA